MHASKEALIDDLSVSLSVCVSACLPAHPTDPSQPPPTPPTAPHYHYHVYHVVHQVKEKASFEFTGTARDQGWQAFIPGETMREDPGFLKDGRLYVDVRARVCVVCVCLGGAWLVVVVSLSLCG